MRADPEELVSDDGVLRVAEGDHHGAVLVVDGPHGGEGGRPAGLLEEVPQDLLVLLLAEVGREVPDEEGHVRAVGVLLQLQVEPEKNKFFLRILFFP